MADPTPTTNGTTKRDLVKVVAALLALCIVAIGILGGLSMFYTPAQWDFVRDIIIDLNTMATLLAGGLLGMVAPKGTG